MDELGLEIMQIALPAAMALTADPIASLVDTAFIGHIGTVILLLVAEYNIKWACVHGTNPKTKKKIGICP